MSAALPRSVNRSTLTGYTFSLSASVISPLLLALTFPPIMLIMTGSVLKPLPPIASVTISVPDVVAATVPPLIVILFPTPPEPPPIPAPVFALSPIAFDSAVTVPPVMVISVPAPV